MIGGVRGQTPWDRHVARSRSCSRTACRSRVTGLPRAQSSRTSSSRRSSTSSRRSRRRTSSSTSSARATRAMARFWRTLRARLVPYLWLPRAATGRSRRALRCRTTRRIGTTWCRRSSSPSAAGCLAGDHGRGKQVPRARGRGIPGLENLFFRFDAQLVERAIERACCAKPLTPLRGHPRAVRRRPPRPRGPDVRHPVHQAALHLRDAVSPPRIRSMARYKVGEWYPSKWKDQSLIRDPKSTVTAGAAVLHLASRNKLPGFLIDNTSEAEQKPIPRPLSGRGAASRVPTSSFPTEPGSRRRSSTRTACGSASVTSIRRRWRAHPSSRSAPRTRTWSQRSRGPRRDPVSDGDGTARSRSRTCRVQRNTYQFDASDFQPLPKTGCLPDRYWLDTGVFKAGARWTKGRSRRRSSPRRAQLSTRTSLRTWCASSTRADHGRRIGDPERLDAAALPGAQKLSTRIVLGDIRRRDPAARRATPRSGCAFLRRALAATHWPKIGETISDQPSLAAGLNFFSGADGFGGEDARVGIEVSKQLYALASAASLDRPHRIEIDAAARRADDERARATQVRGVDHVKVFDSQLHERGWLRTDLLCDHAPRLVPLPGRFQQCREARPVFT